MRFHPKSSTPCSCCSSWSRASTGQGGSLPAIRLSDFSPKQRQVRAHRWWRKSKTQSASLGIFASIAAPFPVEASQITARFAETTDCRNDTNSEIPNSRRHRNLPYRSDCNLFMARRRNATLRFHDSGSRRFAVRIGDRAVNVLTPICIRNAAPLQRIMRRHKRQLGMRKAPCFGARNVIARTPRGEKLRGYSDCVHHLVH